jgi:hypothetical protein
MELPMLKQFEAYQQLWSGAYQQIFYHVTGNRDPLEVDIDFPPIITRDPNNYADSLTKFNQMVPGLAESRSVLMQILMTLGVNNVEEEVEEILHRAEEKRAEILQQAQQATLNSQTKPYPSATGKNQAAEAEEDRGGIADAVENVLLSLADLKDCL